MRKGIHLSNEVGTLWWENNYSFVVIFILFDRSKGYFLLCGRATLI